MSAVQQCRNPARASTAPCLQAAPQDHHTQRLQANTPSKLLHKASQVPTHMVAELSTLNIAMHTQQAEQKSTSLNTQAQTRNTATPAASALPDCTPPQYPGKHNCHAGAPMTADRARHAAPTTTTSAQSKKIHTRPPDPRQTYIPWQHTTQNQSGVTGSQVMATWKHP
jgi:hypothetical protein